MGFQVFAVHIIENTGSRGSGFAAFSYIDEVGVDNAKLSEILLSSAEIQLINAAW